MPPKYGLIWYSTSILGSWNSHWTYGVFSHWSALVNPPFGESKKAHFLDQKRGSQIEDFPIFQWDLGFFPQRFRETWCSRCSPSRPPGPPGVEVPYVWLLTKRRFGARVHVKIEAYGNVHTYAIPNISVQTYKHRNKIHMNIPGVSK